MGYETKIQFLEAVHLVSKVELVKQMALDSGGACSQSPGLAHLPDVRHMGKLWKSSKKLRMGLPL